MAKQAPDIIAIHFSSDVVDIREGRYQGYSNPAVYVVGSDYYCAPTAAQRAPRKDFEPWVEVGEYYGRKVLRSKMAEA